jgi:flagellar motor switch protein FliM
LEKILSTPEDARLSQEEIAALSKTFQAADDPYGIPSPGDPTARPLDLVGMTSIARSTGQAPALDLIHEEFARHLETLLERATREHGSCHAEKVDTQSFAEVYGSLAMPSSIIVVDVVGFASSGLLIIDPRVLFHIIDLTLGGVGGDSDATETLQHRSFTSAERRLINHIVSTIEHALMIAWRDITQVKLRVLRTEVDPRHAAIFRPSDSIVNFTVRVRWGVVEGAIQVLLPVTALRPFDEKLAASSVIKAPSTLERGWKNQIEDLLQEVPIEAVCVLGEKKMPMRALLALEVGSVIRLDTDPDSAIDISLGGLKKFQGTPMSQHGNVAIKLTNVRNKEN